MEVKIQDIMDVKDDILKATRVVDRASGRTLEQYVPTAQDWSTIENALAGADELFAKMLSCAVLRMG